MLRSDKCCEILADTIVEMIAVNKNPFSIPDIDDNIGIMYMVSNTCLHGNLKVDLGNLL